MKRILMLSLGIMFSISMIAQELQTKEQPAENPNAPVITFEKTVHDYGTVPYNGDGKGTKLEFTVFINSE
jgi:hypothetical protein